MFLRDEIVIMVTSVLVTIVIGNILIPCDFVIIRKSFRSPSVAVIHQREEYQLTDVDCDCSFYTFLHNNFQSRDEKALVIFLFVQFAEINDILRSDRHGKYNYHQAVYVLNILVSCYYLQSPV